MDNSDGTSDFAFLRSKNIIDLEKNFKDKIAEIELRHKSYFEMRKSKNVNEAHDILHNHFWTLQRGNEMHMEWEQNSDLKESIKEEVNLAFKSLFGQS